MKLSIIIATYNSEATLHSTLESVKNLVFEDWECLIIDGSSSDSTLEIIEYYKEKDKRFRYISEPDEGIYDALNKGIKLAKGEWIYILGSDDSVTKQGLGDLLRYSNEKLDVIYGNVYTTSRTGFIRKSFSKNPGYLKYSMVGCHQGIIMRRSSILQLGGFNCNYPIIADFDLIQRAYLKKYRFYKTNIFVAYFNKTGISNKQSFKDRLDLYWICKKNKSNKIPLLNFIYKELKYNIILFLKLLKLY